MSKILPNKVRFLIFFLKNFLNENVAIFLYFWKFLKWKYDNISNKFQRSHFEQLWSQISVKKVNFTIFLNFLKKF